MNLTRGGDLEAAFTGVLDWKHAPSYPNAGCVACGQSWECDAEQQRKRADAAEQLATDAILLRGHAEDNWRAALAAKPAEPLLTCAACNKVIPEGAPATYATTLALVHIACAETLAAALRSESPDSEPEYDPDYMCPNCITPWKCNGPHTPQMSPDSEPEAGS